MYCIVVLLRPRTSFPFAKMALNSLRAKHNCDTSSDSYSPARPATKRSDNKPTPSRVPPFDAIISVANSNLDGAHDIETGLRGNANLLDSTTLPDTHGIFVGSTTTSNHIHAPFQDIGPVVHNTEVFVAGESSTDGIHTKVQADTSAAILAVREKRDSKISELCSQSDGDWKGVDWKDFPQGPFDTEDEIVRNINAWCMDSNNGGSFAVTRQGRSGPTRKYLGCDRSSHYQSNVVDSSRPRQHTKKCNCPWGVWIVKVAGDKWICGGLKLSTLDLMKTKLSSSLESGHNHGLITTHREFMNNPNLRHIPEDIYML
jgi:hypothetical protein